MVLVFCLFLKTLTFKIQPLFSKYIFSCADEIEERTNQKEEDLKKVEALAKIRMEEKSQKMAEKEIKQKQVDKSKEDKKSKAYLARHKTKRS